jgi:DNA-binding NarL/FixJ family response regulator
MTDRLNVVIADDHPLFRDGLRRALEADPTIEIVGQATDGEKALSLIVEAQPDLAILDIDMPKMSGLELAREIQRRQLFVAVAMLTIYREEDMFNAAMDAGVRGYILKETAGIDLLDAVRTMAEGRYYFSPILSNFLVSRNQRARDLLKSRPSLADLTPSELRILKLVSQQRTSKEIADELFLSIRTIETHRRNIATKLGIHGTHSLLKFALDNKGSLADR